MLRLLSIVTLVFFAVSTSHAADYNVSSQTTCLALPVSATWIAPSDCRLDADLAIGASDSLTISSGAALVLSSGRTLSNEGVVTVDDGRLLQRGGTVDNLSGGLIQVNGLWDARDRSTINNFSLGTINIENQLQLPQATVNNYGSVFVNQGTLFQARILKGLLSIDKQSKFFNHFSVVNDSKIVVSGLFQNNSTLVNNGTIEFRDRTVSSHVTFENNGIIVNDGSIILDCVGRYEENGAIIGDNPLSLKYCLINGRDWSIPGNWNMNALPPSSADIVIPGTATLDMDFVLTGSIRINGTLNLEKNLFLAGAMVISNFGTLLVDVGSQFDNQVGGSVENNNEFINRGIALNRGEFISNKSIRNYGDFHNSGIMTVNGGLRGLENYGRYKNFNIGFVRSGIDNMDTGIVDNFGSWEMNRSTNTNEGEIRNRIGSSFRLNNTLINKSGALIENSGLFSVTHALTNPASIENEIGALIINNPGGQLNITAAGASLENEGETRNEGDIGNDGIINNLGRICGAGSITGNVVFGDIPELTCNRAPISVASPNAGFFECTGSTTNVVLEGRSSRDPDLRDLLTYNWSPSTGLANPSAAFTSGNFGLGSKNYTFTVTDKLGESDSDGASFIVRDTTAPTLTCPSNITLVADDMCIGTVDPALAQATDICDTSPLVTRSPAGNRWSHGDTAVTHAGIDGSSNTAACVSIVKVVDETIPTIQCNTENVVVNPGVAVSIEATAEDNCSVASVVATTFDCWTINSAGKRIDKTDACVISLDGATVNIADAGGIGTNIGWVIETVDGSGNVETESCQVTSTKPSKKPKKNK